MLRTVIVVASGAAAAAFVANNGQVAGFDIADVPLALIAFVGVSAAVLYTLRWI